MRLRFYLRKDLKTNDGLLHVFMDISFNGTRIRKPVPGVKVKTNHWISDLQRVRKPGKNEGYNFCDEFNLKLDQLHATVTEIKKSVLVNDNKLSDQFILDRLRNPNKIRIDRKDFWAIYQEYLDLSATMKARNTIKGITTAFKFLQKYCAVKKIKANFEEINQSFFEKFRKYAFEERSLGDNYFAKIISSLKAFMSWAHELNYHSNLAYKKFRAAERETEVIYLTIDELFKLYRFPFASRKLAHVRDFYCFGCFTGLRFSDLIGLTRAHIKGDYIIKTIQKTQELDARIPLSLHAKEILAKYQDTAYETLPKISHQKFNDYIKECCRLAGIDSLVNKVRFSGGKRTDEAFPKWQLITSHTARKTFVTNSIILGMKEMVIRNITGHKKEENFKRYVKIADNVKKHEIENTWNTAGV
ncbi:MAG: tyrosine-type recombinase/integrase [Bacteroidetes bacterium]|nr:tyrosine-type recombinase/integrase [Bacteroidota bacterium]